MTRLVADLNTGSTATALTALHERIAAAGPFVAYSRRF
jgi:hypothetical protein